MSRTGAEAWTGLAVTLRWRLPATAAALAEGRIDTYLAKILAEALTPLLTPPPGPSRTGSPASGRADLRAAARRGPPRGDRRRSRGGRAPRQAAERRARRLSHQDGTATLSRTCLPRSTPPPRTPDLRHRPGHEAAALAAASTSCVPRLFSARSSRPFPRFRRRPAVHPTLTRPPTTPTTAGPPAHPASHPPSPSPSPSRTASQPPEPEPAEPRPAEPRPSPPGGSGTSGYDGWDPRRGDPLDDHFGSSAAQWPWPPIPATVPATSGTSPPGTTGPAGTTARPGTTDPPGTTSRAGSADPPHSAARPGNESRPPPGGLLDVTLPWATFTGSADAPGNLGRIGPITAPQARQAVNLALRDARTQWRGPRIPMAVPSPSLASPAPSGSPASPASPASLAPPEAAVPAPPHPRHPPCPRHRHRRTGHHRHAR